MSRSSSRNRLRQRGYTLAELLTTMSILGILGSVAIPGMENIMLDNRRVSVTNDFVRALQLARSEAAARNQRVTVCASTNGTACGGATNWNLGWIVFNDIDRSGQPNGDDESILLYVQNSDGISITPEEFAGSVTYRPNGQAMAATIDENSGEFTFCDRRGAEQARVLQIAGNGRPIVAKTGADGTAPECK